MILTAINGETGKPMRLQTCDLCGRLGEGHYFPGSHSGQCGHGEYWFYICNDCYHENYRLLPKPIEEELFIGDD
jgi:hypothetical protein